RETGPPIVGAQFIAPNWGADPHLQGAIHSIVGAQFIASSWGADPHLQGAMNCAPTSFHAPHMHILIACRGNKLAIWRTIERSHPPGMTLIHRDKLTCHAIPDLYRCIITPGGNVHASRRPWHCLHGALMSFIKTNGIACCSISSRHNCSRPA